MRKLIINADDCGRTKHVDERIEFFINQKKISSATIMANMEDFDGAITLYKKYKDIISFGVHLNLTEGEPLLYSQVMLDYGLYVEHDDAVIFNTQWARNKCPNKHVRKAIEAEFNAQIGKIRDFGVDISHIDSHHHIHTTLLCLQVIPLVLKQNDILRLRRLCNYRAFDLSYVGRQIWANIIKIQNSRIKFPDYFSDYGTVLNDVKKGCVKDGVIEIMCHPGGIYEDEEHLMLDVDIVEMLHGMQISYNDI